jgi:hypothetical protein
MMKQSGTLLLALLLAASCIEIGANLVADGRLSYVRSAEARVGRPLTPVSVAGVGRRTVRRCAVGVYYC